MINKIFYRIILRQDDLFGKIIRSIEEKSSQIYTYFSFHCMNEFYENKNYSLLLLNDINVYAADFGIYLLLKILGYKSIKKFNGSDFNKLIIHYMLLSNKKYYFIGGNFTSAELQKIKPNLSGYQNGFFKTEDESEILNNIEKSESDLVIIGMGIPKQEILAKKIKEYGAKVPILCVGNFMEFYLGTVKRAPKIIRGSGLEWIFRLLTEPKRLWKRYLIGIPKFIYRSYLIYYKNLFIK